MPNMWHSFYCSSANTHMYTAHAHSITFSADMHVHMHRNSCNIVDILNHNIRNRTEEWWGLNMCLFQMEKNKWTTQFQTFKILVSNRLHYFTLENLENGAHNLTTTFEKKNSLDKNLICKFTRLKTGKMGICIGNFVSLNIKSINICCAMFVFGCLV